MKKRCPNCGSEALILDQLSGELKCMECGLVLEESVIDYGPEWRAYDEEQRLARARAEPIRPMGEASTVIGHTGKISIARRSEFTRLALIQKFISREKERRLDKGRNEINRLAAAIGAPSQVREEAVRLFDLVQRNGSLRGRSVAGMAAACVALACREFGLPNPLPMLYKLSAVEEREVRRCYMVLLELVSRQLRLKPPSPLKYLPMIASKLGLSAKVQRTAAEIIKSAGKAHLLFGKPPRNIATAALYLSAVIHGERKPRSKFSAAAGVTETTLRKHVKELNTGLNITVYI